MRRALFATLLLALLSACTVEPPVELEKDPNVTGSLGSALATLASSVPTLALAPVSLGYLHPNEALFLSTASVTSASPLAAGDEGHEWDKPPADPVELQRHFAQLLGLALGKDRIATIGRGSIPTPVGDDVESSRRLLEAATCDAADQAHAELLVHIDVVENRIAWKSRRLELWIPDLFLLWAAGAVPVLWVPDEEYESRVRVRVTVVHARTRERLFQGEYEGSVEMALNTFQRGLTLSGLVGLDPLFLSPESGDYDAPQAGLFPQALRDLDQKIARSLPRSLVEALEVPENLKLVHDGTPATARTYAIVVGHNGPNATRPRPPLRYGTNDAETMAEALLKTGLVRSRAELRLLADESHATRSELFAAIDDLVPRLLGLDRLIVYFSGYGKTTADGEQVLVLGGETLSASQLADHLGRAVLSGRKPRVVFLLDTSFGAEPLGKNYPDEAAGKTGAYLEPLANRSLGWTVIAAAGAGEAAYEIDARSPGSRHGFFTQRLLAAFAEREGPLTTDDLIAYLGELVPEDVRSAEQAEQTPEKRGLDEPVALGTIRHE